MDMAAVIDEMVPAPPESPGPGQSSALEQPPEVMKEARVKNRGAKRCLSDALFGKPPRSPSPDDPPEVLLSPRRVMLPEVDAGASASQDKGKDKAEAGAAHERPCKVLRMQMRRSGKGMSGGSSAHNAAPLQRSLSVYVPFSPPPAVEAAEDAQAMDPETLFAQSHLPGLRTPPRACRLEVDVAGLSPLKGLNLDLDFEQFEQFHMSD